MNAIKDLLSRLFLHYQSSLTGLAVVIITWLSDHGVSLSESNSKVLTVKLVAWGIALIKICSKDKGTPTDDTDRAGSGPVIGSNLRSAASFALIGTLLIGSLLTSACGKATTLNRIGVVFVQGSAAYKAELQSLHVGGQLGDEKFARLDAQASQIQVTAKALADYLNGLADVNAQNKPQLLAKIAEALGLLRGVVANPDLISAGANSTAVKVLNIAIITLDNAAVAVAAINVGTASRDLSASAPAKSVPTSSIKVVIPKPPKEVEKYFR